MIFFDQLIQEAERRAQEGDRSWAKAVSEALEEARLHAKAPRA